MTLRAHHARVLAHLFAAPDDRASGEAAEAPLHDRWNLYREMARNRLFDLASGSLPRTKRALGDARFDSLFTAWLAASPPKSPYFWRVATEFGAFVESRIADDEANWLHDLVRFERARWFVRHAEFPVAVATSDLVFDAIPIVSPAILLLDVDHAIETDFESVPEARPATLAIHRRPTDEVRVFVLNEPGAALLSRLVAAGDETLANRALAVARARDTRIDDAYFEALATLLAALVEEGIVLGSMPA